MGLGFLGDFLGQAAPVASGIGGLLDAFGFGKPKANYGPTPSEAQANSLFQALLDPNNSLVKQNSDMNMQKGMQDLLMNLRLIQMQNARGQARGIRPAFFNPERADETINYLLTRGQVGIADQARATAKDDIRQTATSLKGFGDAEQKRRDAQQMGRDRDYAEFQTAGGYGGAINKGMGGLQDLFNILFQNKTNAPANYGPFQTRMTGQ